MKRKIAFVCAAVAAIVMAAGAAWPGTALAAPEAVELPKYAEYFARADADATDGEIARAWLEAVLDTYMEEPTAYIASYEIGEPGSLTEQNIPDGVKQAERELEAKGNTALLAEFETMRRRARMVRMRFSIVPAAGLEDAFGEWGARRDGGRLVCEWIGSIQETEARQDGASVYGMIYPFRVMDPLTQQDADAAGWIEEMKAGAQMYANDLSPDGISPEYIVETPENADMEETASIWAEDMMELYAQAGAVEWYTVETEAIDPPKQPDGYDEWMAKAEEEGMNRFARQLEKLVNPQAYAKVTVSMEPAAGKSGVFANWGAVDGDGVITSEWAASRRTYTFPFYYDSYEDDGMAYHIVSHIPYEEYREHLDSVENRNLEGMYESTPELDPPQEGPYQYKIEDGALAVTYDGGENWTGVPLSAEYYSEYIGKDGTYHYDVIQQGGYLVTPEKTVFVYGQGWYDAMDMPYEPVLRCVYSDDMGETWTDSAVSLTGGPFVWVCAFEGDAGRITVSTDRRGHEQTTYYTSNGGETWSPTPGLMDYGARYIDDETGFMPGNRPGAYLYRTADGGRNWFAVEYERDMEYIDQFYWPDYPKMEDGALVWDIYKDDQSDFEPGKLEKLRYVSDDGGETFRFVERMDATAEEYRLLPWYRATLEYREVGEML